MNRKKRDKHERAFRNGYHAGAKGHSSDFCPYSGNLSKREQWLGGWREGWDDYQHMKH